MHGTRASGISIDDVRGVELRPDAKREAGGAASLVCGGGLNFKRADFAEKFPGKILLADWAPDPSRRTRSAAGRAAAAGGGRAPERSRASCAGPARTFAEWYAPSRCDHLVASRSGFSRTAAAAAVAATPNASVRYVGRDAPCRRADAGSPTERLLVEGGAGL